MSFFRRGAKRADFCFWAVQSINGKSLIQVPVTEGRHALQRAIDKSKKTYGLPPRVWRACERTS